MTEAGVPKIDTSGECGWTGGRGGGRMHWVELVRTVTLVEYHPCTASFTEKPTSSNSTVIGFSRARRRTETRLVTKSGEARTIDMLIGVEVEGNDI